MGKHTGSEMSTHRTEFINIIKEDIGYRELETACINCEYACHPQQIGSPMKCTYNREYPFIVEDSATCRRFRQLDTADDI